MPELLGFKKEIKKENFQMIQLINSKQNQKIKDVIKLSKQSERNLKKEFVIEGFHLFEMALNSGLVKYIFVTKENAKIPAKVQQYLVSEEIMKKISCEVSPQGIVAVCGYLPSKPSAISDRVLYLDDVSDPGNLGTILRTALAFEYKTIILSEKCCSIYNQKVIQSSQGALFNLNIFQAENNTLLNLKKDGYQIISTEIKGNISLSKIKANGKHILVLGNEAHGVSKKILAESDLRVRIDIKEIESLNVAIAGAIVMYELTK